MFAVIKTGGKQYRVVPDDVLKIEKVAGEVGEIVQIGEVLAYGEGESITIGAPFVGGASVAVEVVEQGRAKTVIAFKKRRRQNSRRTRGHRQLLTTVRISEILTDGAKPKKVAKPAATKTAATGAEASEKGAKPQAKAKDAAEPEAKAEVEAQAKEPAAEAAENTEKAEKPARKAAPKKAAPKKESE
jgi:large subunit ribosomal protein L21